MGLRFSIIGALFLIASSIVVYRLYDLQGEEHLVWLKRASGQHMTSVKVQSARGNIVDRNGNLLAVSVPTLAVGINPTSSKCLKKTSKMIHEYLGQSKKEVFDPKKIALNMVFNTYFGRGLSSIVFQEIRESKSLAYSAWSKYSLASKKNKPNYLNAYIGTQANKLPEALNAMKELLNEMPLNEAQFETAKTSVLKKLAASRITKTGIFKEYERLKKLGIEKDNRKEIYDLVQNITLKDLNEFFQDSVKNSQFDLLIVANKKDIDFKVLEQFGKVKELTAQYLFNF